MATRRLQAISEHLAPSGRKLQLGNASDRMPVLIGAMVIDVHSFPAEPLRAGTTVIGKVQYNFGGVARNVAECMAKLGQPCFLISIVGSDVPGQALLSHWTSLGLPTEGIKACAGCTTPVITAAFNEDGEIAAGVADTAELEKQLTPEWILQFTEVIQQAPLVLLDANLPFPSLQAACQLARKANVPVWFEPVSVPKSVRAAGLLDSLLQLTYVSPNKEELLSMGKAVSPTVETVKDCVHLLLGSGVQHVVLTLGSQGVLLCTKSRSVHIPALPASVSSLSGAGDCLVAGSLVALCSGMDSTRMIAYGVSAAKQAVQSPKNVPETLSRTQVEVDVKTAMSSISESIDLD